MDHGVSNDVLAVPPDLVAEIEAEAARDKRQAADVLCDAVNRYVREKRWQRLLAAGHARAKALGFTENDVPRLIAEFREEQRKSQ